MLEAKDPWLGVLSGCALPVALVPIRKAVTRITCTG